MKDCLPVSLLSSWQKRTLSLALTEPRPRLYIQCSPIFHPNYFQPLLLLQDNSLLRQLQKVRVSLTRSVSLFIVPQVTQREKMKLFDIPQTLSCQVLQPAFVDIPTSVNIIEYVVQIMTPQSLYLLKEVLIYTLCGHSLLKVRSDNNLT